MLQKAKIGAVDADIKFQIDWWHGYLEELHDNYFDNPKFKNDLSVVMKVGYKIISNLAQKGINGKT